MAQRFRSVTANVDTYLIMQSCSLLVLKICLPAELTSHVDTFASY